MSAAMTPGMRRLFMAIAIFAVIGLAVSSVSLYHHYGTSKTDYCDIGENFNCDIVNRSVYSTVFGIPDALIGILGYAVLLFLATKYRNRLETPIVLFVGCLAGLSFALYLTYIEKYVLATWCILCLSSLTTISLLTILSGVLLASSRRTT